jgi:hypothetical protein
MLVIDQLTVRRLIIRLPPQRRRQDGSTRDSGVNNFSKVMLMQNEQPYRGLTRLKAGRLHFEVSHEVHHADDFGSCFIVDKQFAEFVVVADFVPACLLPAPCFTVRHNVSDQEVNPLHSVPPRASRLALREPMCFPAGGCRADALDFARERHKAITVPNFSSLKHAKAGCQNGAELAGQTAGTRRFNVYSARILRALGD